MNHFISLSEAASLTRRFREHRDAMAKTGSNTLQALPICETFDRAAFESLLAQSDCRSIRIYYGMYEDDTVHAVIVGVNSAGADIIPSGGTSLAAEGDGIVEMGQRCPVICPPSSPLNQ